MKNYLIAALVCIALASCQTAATQNSVEEATLPTTDHLKETKFSNDEMMSWTFTGLGKFYVESGRQVVLQESDASFGVGIFTPESYTGDVVLRYKIMALNAATVLVNLLCMADGDGATELTLPTDYDGSMGPILSKANYFVAFRNSPHATAPFISKNPGMGQLVIAERDELLPGVYYDVEAGRVGKTLWLSVDGETVVSVDDTDVLPGGHLAIRLRGLVGHPAACIIRDVAVWSE